MLLDRRRRRVVGVLVVVSLMLAALGWGYLALAASGEDRLVTKGVQQITICGGPRESEEIWYKLTEEVPGADGTWGTEGQTRGDGDCKVWHHYAPGPADQQSCGMDQVNRVVDRAITVIVLGIFLAPIALYALLLVTAFSFYLVSRVWPCDWPLHQPLEGFNPDCPDIDTADQRVAPDRRSGLIALVVGLALSAALIEARRRVRLNGERRS